MTYAKRHPRLPAALVAVALAFLAFSLPPYFTGHTRVPATFTLHYPLLVSHVMFAAVAMLTALAQIWPGLRARRPALHRRCGRVYVVTAIPAAVCALIIGALTPFGPFLAVSNVVLATLWLWFTINGYLAARRRRFGAHRRHMILSATLALSIITNRMWTPALFVTLKPLQDSIFHLRDEHYLWCVAGLGAWLGWTIPFVAVRRWLNRRATPRPPIGGSTIRPAHHPLDGQTSDVAERTIRVEPRSTRADHTPQN
ncbi:DUF2306 domain-containing protein [Mycolicibacterium rhodesiae]|uniref:DUF2306 domain-containing protein n=1 Tax=Mycolicibacterium rhodesiae TaxID=36814 RepID=UPI0009F2BE6A|nr:DUF2306 domain-containing protein [Mycolicibacterium rhodesiae]MCV7347192.1 DUF2306 domain-containing protein [Mycolicibacterium rhodesiae]